MADLLYDVIRVVDTKENMSSTLKSKMLGFTSDTNEIAFKDAAGDMYYYKNYNDIDDLINRTGSQYWIVPVKSEIDLTSEEPASPVKGDRYINTATGTSSETSQEVAEDYVYTWSGSEWTETAPIEGMIVLNKNEESIKSYLSSTWVAVYAHTLSEVLTAGNDAGGLDINNLGTINSIDINTLSGDVSTNSSNIDTLLGNYVKTDEPTGFVDPWIDVSYDSTTRTITLSDNGSHIVEALFQGQEVSDLVDGWESPVHDDPAGTPTTYFLTHDGTSASWSTDPESFPFNKILIAIVFRNGANFCLREVHGLMGHRAHKEFHDNIGTYLASGGNITSYALGSTTLSDRRPVIGEAVIYDEDLPTTIAEVSSGNYSWLYLSGTDSANLDTDNNDIVDVDGDSGKPYYNELSGGSYSQAIMANNDYQKIYVMAIPATSDAECQKTRIVFIQGQKVSTSLQEIQNINFGEVDLGNLGVALPEYVPIAEIIIQASVNNWELIEVNKLTGSRIQQVVNPSLTTPNVKEVLTAGNDAGGNDILNLGSITATDTVTFSNLSSGTGRLLTQNSSDGELQYNDNLSYDGDRLQIVGSNSNIVALNNSDDTSNSYIQATYSSSSYANKLIAMGVYGKLATGTIFGINKAHRSFIRSYSDILIGTLLDDDLILCTNNTKQMTIKSGGAVEMHNLSSGDGNIVVRDSTGELKDSGGFTIDNGEPIRKITPIWAHSFDNKTARMTQNANEYTEPGQSEGLSFIGIRNGNDLILEGVANLTVYNKTGSDTTLPRGSVVYFSNQEYSAGEVSDLTGTPNISIKGCYIGYIEEGTDTVSNLDKTTAKVRIDKQIWKT